MFNVWKWLHKFFDFGTQPFSSIKLFIYCSEQTTCSILIRHVVVVLSHILSLVSPALWRQWLGGWLAESEVTFTLALQIISTVLWCPGSSSLSFTLRYTGCLHLIVVVTLPWSCLGKHKNWMDVGWGHQPAPARAGPVQHHSRHAAGDSEATWARDQHVATIASFQHSAGHQVVLGGLFPTLYFIGAASVATPVPTPRPGRCRAEPVGCKIPGVVAVILATLPRCQQPSCFYKRLSRIKWRVEVSVWFPW